MIQFLDMHSLSLHFKDILINPNMLTSHIHCLNAIRIQNIHTN